MPIEVRSPGWRIASERVSRGTSRDTTGSPLKSLPPEFIPATGTLAEEVILEARPTVRGAAAPAALDLEYDVATPGESAALVIRHASGALTFHAPSTTIATRGTGPQGGARLRFQVPMPAATPATRGLADRFVKAMIVKVAKTAADTATAIVLPKAIEAVERSRWNQLGLREGWHKVTRETLASGQLQAGAPTSAARTLLLIHGTFSHAAAAFSGLAQSTFFDRVKHLYGDRIYAFNHFSLCRTPIENARMLLDGLPASGVTFDVITHSRGGLVLRELAERRDQFKTAGKRFILNNTVLVASPNDGTPLATPKRWEDTLGTIANLFELLPDNGFTTAGALVANGVVWLATHASVDVPGLSAMDGRGEAIETLQANASRLKNLPYSALVANYQPDDTLARRLVDAGIDQFFGSANDLVVPSEGGWRIGRGRPLIPSSRIGCFGPGGNLDAATVAHTAFFSRPETIDFLVTGLEGADQPLRRVDPLRPLPDHRLVRGTRRAAALAAAATAAAREIAAATTAVAETTPLSVEVVNGDLTYISEPLMLGHYRSSRLTGTERVMNRLLGGELNRSLAAGLYPDQIGSHQVFVNTRTDYARGTLPRPEAVIIAGLGEEGALTGTALVQTIRQAVLAWAQACYTKREGEGHDRGTASADGRRKPLPPGVLAATLIGSGGATMGAGESARLIVRGVAEANSAMADAGSQWPRIGTVKLIELYQDRAAEAWRELKLQLSAQPGAFTLAPVIQAGRGSLLRPVQAGYRGADYDFISVSTARDDRGKVLLSYNLDTRRARTEVRAQRGQSRLLRHLITSASNDRESGKDIRRTLFNLLVPIELEAYLTGSDQVVIELDGPTADIPWELLDTNSPDPVNGGLTANGHAGMNGQSDVPWGIRVTLIRKLKTATFRERPADASADAHVLIIGEPECSQDYAPLPGARAEAMAVAERLRTQLPPGCVELLSSEERKPGPNARTVLDALFRQSWRILHISGHGVPPDGRSDGGVVLSDNTFLGAAEIGSLRSVPQLVFVNCCYLAAGESRDLLNTTAKPHDRVHFAASVARSLINVGVRCIVAAGWAVDDDVARLFAEVFYGRILENASFAEAVKAARHAAWSHAPDGNTWAAYQCYGDPDWRLDPARASDGSDTWNVNVGDTLATQTQVELALRRIVATMRSASADEHPTVLARQRDEFRQLEQLVADKWKGKVSGSVAEAFGDAAVDVGELERGVGWLEQAVNAPDGRASLKAAETLANVRARLAWERVDAAVSRRQEATTRRAQREATQTLREALKDAPRAIDGSLALLRTLSSVQATAERHSLVGGTHKRAALIALVGRDRRSAPDLAAMKAAYDEALNTAKKSGGDINYAAINCLLAAVMEKCHDRRPQTLDAQLVGIVRKVSQGKDVDFWGAAAGIELHEYEAIAARRLAARLAQLTREFKALHERVKAPHMWASVYDSARLVLLTYRQACAARAKAGGAAARAAGREADAADKLIDQLRKYAARDV